MRRFTLILLALLFAPALPALAQSGMSADVTQVDSSRYPDVTVYVRVKDAAGQPVGALTTRDFGLAEDGQPVEISGFAGGGASPVSAMLVIDRSSSMDESDKIEGARDAAQAFVGQMRPGDRTGLLAFNSRSRVVQDFTGSQNDLTEAIARIEPDGGTALYDSIVAGVGALAKLGGRRALVVLTDGQDCRESTVCPRSYGSSHSLDEAIAAANAAGQPLYVIGLGERGGGERDGIDETVLRRLASETGGEYFYAPSADQLAGLYRSLSAGIQREYALTYRSPRPFYDGTRRDIRVSVGGAPAASGRYVEQHLIDVRSDPLVGALLLLPILGALLLPALIRPKTKGQAATPGMVAPAVAGSAAPAAMIGSTIVQPPPVVVVPTAVARCASCDAPLLRAGARFCSSCGARQTAAPVAPRRIFCDQCGRPMLPGARYCAECGATAAVAVQLEA